MVNLERSAVVDLYGDLTSQIDELKKRAKPLEAVIESWSEGTPAEKPFEVSGEKYHLILGACGWKRSIKSMSELFKYFKKPRFLELCSIALGILDKELPRDIHHHYIEQTQTGPRTWKIEPVGKPAENVVSIASKKRKAA